MRYTETTVEKAKKALTSIGNDMEIAYDIKRQEIADNHLPSSATSKLTDAEIRRAQKVGVALGVFVIVVLLLLVLYFAWGLMV